MEVGRADMAEFSASDRVLDCLLQLWADADGVAKPWQVDMAARAAAVERSATFIFSFYVSYEVEV